MKQSSMLPFPNPPPRRHSPSPPSEAPLDLGKNRKDEQQSFSCSEVRAPKREACDNDVDENDCDDLESESDEEADITIPSNSSQGE